MHSFRPQTLLSLPPSQLRIKGNAGTEDKQMRIRGSGASDSCPGTERLQVKRGVCVRDEG